MVLRRALFAAFVAFLAAVPLRAASAPGTPGTHGVPQLASAEPVFGGPFATTLSSAREQAPFWLLWSPLPGPTPSSKGLLGVGLPFTILLADVTSAAGDYQLVFALPDDAALFGVPWNVQCAVADPVAAKGVALSNSVNTVLWGADLDVDADRDGLVEPQGAEDDAGEAGWSAALGAVVLHNADDDDGNGQVDALNGRVDGPADALDLAPLELRPLPALPAGWSGELVVDADDAPWVRLFREVAPGTWQRFDPQLHNPLDAGLLAAGARFGLEALDFAQTAVAAPGLWDGDALLTLRLLDGTGAERSRDTVSLRVAPLLLHSNLDAAEKVVAVANGSTAAFIAALQPPLAAAGAAFEAMVDPAYDIWAQDAMEFGYSLVPAPAGPRRLESVLRSPRAKGADAWTLDECLGPDFGYVFKGDYRPGVGWIDWFGNLDCTPPLPGWPFGRIYTGYQGAITMHPDVLAFLEAQGVQAPVLQVDTGWLLIGHVDEEICFVPSATGKPFRVLMPDTTQALAILQELQAQGHGGATVFAGTGDQTTVSALLAWTQFVAYNASCQVAIDAVRQQVKDGFGLDDADILGIPSLFWKLGTPGRAVAHMPNMVNALVVGTHVIASDPFGPVIGGVDAFQQPVRDALEPLGLTVDFVDDWSPYHTGLGEVHCGTNAVRAPHAAPWWQDG